VPNPVGAIPTPVPRSVIYDPVWKTSTVIPNEEHQVAGLQHGKVNKTDETVGPTGDFYMRWRYVEDGAPPNQPF